MRTHAELVLLPQFCLQLVLVLLRIAFAGRAGAFEERAYLALDREYRNPRAFTGKV